MLISSVSRRESESHLPTARLGGMISTAMHGALVKRRRRQPSIPVLHALEIVTARPRLPGDDGAVSNVPPAEGSTGNRRGLPSHGHRVVGGRGPKVIAQPIEWLVRVRP